MTSIVVVGEDELCCSLGSRIVGHCLPGWRLPLAPIDTKGVTKLRANLERYQSLARMHHVLCIADTDGHCVSEMLRLWQPDGTQERLTLRFAVNEADAWAIADRTGFAHAFGVSPAIVPRDPDEVRDVKREVLTMAARSKKRVIRDEVPSQRDPTKPGSGYNAHLCGFVRGVWRVDAAAAVSASLARAVRAVSRLADRT